MRKVRHRSLAQVIHGAHDKTGLPLTNSHNVRSVKLSFHIPHAGVMHGLAGYFEAILYGDVGLSIHPYRKEQISKDMLSWFPLFFPFRVCLSLSQVETLSETCLFQEPLYLPSNSELQVSMWRLTNERQVWYEWYAESYLPVANALLPVEHATDGAVSDGPSSSSTSTLVAVPSPIVDALDMFNFPVAEPRSETRPGSMEIKSPCGVVKIGQTALHNPGGRSSWIGLT